MSFAWPAALIALIAIPLAVRLYLAEQRRRERAAGAFVTPPLRASVAPSGPGLRRHAPLAALLLAATLLIVAAARPQTSSAVAVQDGAVMLVDDTSASMASADIAPTRLGAAVRAARSFIDGVPAQVRVGVETFNDRPTVRQSPTTDHAVAKQALGGLIATGHTAIGDALNAALRVLQGLRSAGGRRPPGAIVLISDGTSTTGADPRAAARQAAADHVPVFTVAVGTARGTIRGSHGPNPVPLDASELSQIAALSHAQTFTAGTAGGLQGVYRGLAATIGHRTVNHEITAGFAGAGLVLLLCGSALSLYWFGRIA